jgi:hypothetical protein
MVIVQGSTVEILTGDIPASESTASPTLKQVAKFTTPQLVTHADFSPNDSRFFTAEYAGGTMVYDLELSQASQTTFTAAQTRQLEWLNGYHFASTAGGSFYYYDFDGANGQLVAANTLDLPVAMSENSKYLYHFGIVDGKTILILTKLTTS